MHTSLPSRPSSRGESYSTMVVPPSTASRPVDAQGATVGPEARERPRVDSTPRAPPIGYDNPRSLLAGDAPEYAWGTNDP